MEHENMYASRGVGNTALGLSIGALAANLIPGGLNGILGNIGTNRVGACDHVAIDRMTLELMMRNSALESEVKFRDSSIYTDQKILETYKSLKAEIDAQKEEICNQKVYNATLNGAVGCIQSQIAQLQALTKLVIPNSSVCPGWGSATVTVTPATTTAA